MSVFILRIICSDEKGLVYKTSKVLFENNLSIIKNDEFVDNENEMFFMRTEYSGLCDKDKIISDLKNVLPTNVQIFLEKSKVKNVILLVTKEHHCLSDLLIRNQYKDLNFNILAVIGNHDVLQPLVEKFNIPFHFISSENITREKHENLILKTIEKYTPDYIVLAKFMRILTGSFIDTFKYKIINIHHSFLPAFIGANPYMQAYNRGVKIIGATAHFVTIDLDEGPIIYQDVIQVSHSKTAQDMARSGKDVEKIVLANALKLVFEDKIFINTNKTIIFE